MGTENASAAAGTVDAAAVAAAAAAAASAGEKPWYDGADADTVGYLQNRGLDKLKPNEAALKAVGFHRNAEKLLGGPADGLVRVPKDAADTATQEALWNRLGRPEKPEGYDFAGMEGNDDFLKFAAPLMHKLGFTKDQGREWTKNVIAEVTRQHDAAESAKATAFEVEKQAVLKDWGGAADANLIVAQNAADKLGLTKAQIEGIESQIGFAQTMTMFFKLGTKIGEDTFVQSGFSAGQTRITSKEQARSKINELKMDSDYVNKWLAGDSEKVKQMHDLHALLAQE